MQIPLSPGILSNTQSLAEPSPVIHEDSFVGHGALVIGGIEIGPRAYVCAGAVVTRNVPAYHIASSVNQIIHYTEWRGPLRDNPLFSEEVSS